MNWIQTMKGMRHMAAASIAQDLAAEWKRAETLAARYDVVRQISRMDSITSALVSMHLMEELRADRETLAELRRQLANLYPD